MKDLQHFKIFVNKINLNNSRLYKQEVLENYKNDEVIQFFLKYAFDPFIQFGLGEKKLLKSLPAVESMPVISLLNYLNVYNTGTDVDVAKAQAVITEVEQVDSEAADLLRSIICKDLSIGVDAKSINKKMPGLIQQFSLQLANKYFDKPGYVEGKEFALTTKIDGGRIIALKEDGQVTFYTRAGQKYDGLVDLENEMKNFMPDNICLDGEITLLNPESLASKDQYKATMKIVRKTTEKEKHGVKMLVFDWMPAEDFKKQQCNFSYSDRRDELAKLFNPSKHNFIYFNLLPVLYKGTDTSKITELLDKLVSEGEEGVMVNICDAKYEFKRTNNLLKVKKMQTMDLEIIGLEEGGGRLAGTLGAVIVRYKDGNTVKVGSGFSDDIRKEIWENPNKYMGSIIEVQYFEETENAKDGCGLRFPIFKDFRPDKLEADY